VQTTQRTGKQTHRQANTSKHAGTHALHSCGHTHLVEEQNLRAPNNGTCNCHTLLLATRQTRSSLAHDRVVPLLKLRDEVVRIRHASHLLHFRVGYIARDCAKLDVVCTVREETHEHREQVSS